MFQCDEDCAAFRFASTPAVTVLVYSKEEHSKGDLRRVTARAGKRGEALPVRAACLRTSHPGRRNALACSVPMLSCSLNHKEK